MAKKIKFSLEMAKGVQVRTIEELRESFDLEKIVEYFIDGRLSAWLNGRNYEREAEQIIKLSKDDIEIDKKLCNIFDIEYNEDTQVNIEEIKQKKQKIDKLKQFTDDEKILSNVNSVAFSQEELAELLDAGKDFIYLYKGEFSVPLSRENVTYVGISNVMVNFNTLEMSVLSEKNITFKNITISNEGEKIDIENLYKKEWQVFLKEMHYFDARVERSYEDNQGRVYNIKVNTIFAKDKFSGNEIRVTEEKESAEEYITYDSKVFYTVGDYNEKKIFVRDLNNNIRLQIGDYIRKFEKFLYVNKEYIFYKNSDSQYYSVNYKTMDVKEIYNPINNFNSLIHNEIFTEKYFIYIDRNYKMYRKNVITGESKYMFDNVKLVTLHRDDIYMIRETSSENIYKLNIESGDTEFICHTQKMHYGSVKAIEIIENNIVWINSGINKYNLNIVNLTSKKVIKLDEWIGNLHNGGEKLKIEGDWIYYDNLNVLSTYDRINRKIKIDGTGREDLQNNNISSSIGKIMGSIFK